MVAAVHLSLFVPSCCLASSPPPPPPPFRSLSFLSLPLRTLALDFALLFLSFLVVLLVPRLFFTAPLFELARF